MPFLLALSAWGPMTVLAVLSAQASPRIRLAPAVSRFPQEFNQIDAVRELSDGRVVVLDRTNQESRLTIVDLRQGTVLPIGRVGAGPQEYRSPYTLVALGGDTSLLTDEGLRRWLILERDRIAAVIPPDNAVVKALGPRLLGGDVRGRVLSIRPFHSPGRMPMTAAWYAESTYLVRGDVGQARVDTVAKLRGGGARLQEVRLVRPDTDFNPPHLLPNPLITSDQALLFPDGWIAIVRKAPYQVDWLQPSGTWKQGRPLPIAATRMTEAERRAAMERRFGERGRATPTSVFKDWPPEVPPFLDDALLAMPSGHVVVRRTPTTASPDLDYDIVDRLGLRQAVIRVSSRERIVAFGKRGVYLSVTDDDGLHRLELHPLPDLPGTPR
ncbi:MAG TPA: hypothetical protein VFN96_10450 [Gemmatimonadales bacterium]|nr:hypothetical protein [Gemmatimonadales bacterium]